METPAASIRALATRLSRRPPTTSTHRQCRLNRTEKFLPQCQQQTLHLSVRMGPHHESRLKDSCSANLCSAHTHPAIGPLCVYVRWNFHTPRKGRAQV